MKSVLSRSRTLVVTAIMAGVFAAPWPLAAQQAPAGQAPAAAPASPAAAQTSPPPSWMQGAPGSAEESHLAPQVPPPIPTAADKLPVAELKLPKNFHLEVYASGVPNARSLRVGDKGTVFVSTRTLDRIYAIVDNNGKREVKVLATGLNSPERHRPAQRHALYRRDQQDLEDRQCRDPARQPAEADGHLQRSAERRAARLEVPDRRARQ